MNGYSLQKYLHKCSCIRYLKWNMVHYDHDFADVLYHLPSGSKEIPNDTVTMLEWLMTFSRDVSGKFYYNFKRHARKEGNCLRGSLPSTLRPVDMLTTAIQLEEFRNCLYWIMSWLNSKTNPVFGVGPPLIQTPYRVWTPTSPFKSVSEYGPSLVDLCRPSKIVFL